MQNVSSGANGEVASADYAIASDSPPHVDPGYALIRAIAPNAATLVHNAIMDMLRAPPASHSSR